MLKYLGHQVWNLLSNDWVKILTWEKKKGETERNREREKEGNVIRSEERRVGKEC